MLPHFHSSAPLVNVCGICPGAGCYGKKNHGVKYEVFEQQACVCLCNSSVIRNHVLRSYPYILSYTYTVAMTDSHLIPFQVYKKRRHIRENNSCKLNLSFNA